MKTTKIVELESEYGGHLNNLDGVSLEEAFRLMKELKERYSGRDVYFDYEYDYDYENQPVKYLKLMERVKV